MTTFTTQDRQDAQRTPLTKAQIDAVLESMGKYVEDTPEDAEVIEFVRAIERAHGIGE
jgi:CBS-domain-containing membrane protein